MSTPRVSVLMAVYNGGDALSVSLQSMVDQMFTDWEMVVVDDASTDETCAVVEEFVRRDARFRLITNAKNKGQTACLNQGLGECRGEWVARQDADDISHPRRLAAQVEYVEKHPETMLLGTQGVLIDEGGRRIGLLDVPCEATDIAWCAPFLNPFLHTSVMFRRVAVLAAGGYDESFRIAQDYELWMRLRDQGPMANLAERLVSYRHTETSLSKSGRSLAFVEAQRVSAREVRHWLGREWTMEEASLVEDFRQGSTTLNRRAFWKMIKSLEDESDVSFSVRLRAAWHLRIAGANRSGALEEMGKSFIADAPFTLRWIFERWVNF